jgi:hypothetical protein
LYKKYYNTKPIMNRTFTTFTILLLLNILITACSSQNQQAPDGASNLSLRQQLDTITQAISPEIAILIAETFVAQQGYTDLPVDLNKQTLQFEKGEYASDTNQILQLRQHTLQKQAVGVRQYGDNSEKWAVGFKPINGDNNIIRAVTMDSLARLVIMQSQNIREDWLLGKVK